MVCVCQMKPHNLGVTSKYSPLAVERYSKETLGWAESGLTQAHLRDGYGTYIYGWLLQFLNMTRCLEWHRKCECVMEVLSGTWNSRPSFRQKGTFQSTQISLLRCVCCCWALQSVYRLPWSLGLTVLNAREQQISSVIQTQKQTVVWRLQEEPKAGLKRMSLPILSCASMLDGALAGQPVVKQALYWQPVWPRRGWGAEQGWRRQELAGLGCHRAARVQKSSQLVHETLQWRGARNAPTWGGKAHLAIFKLYFQLRWLQIRM